MSALREGEPNSMEERGVTKPARLRDDDGGRRDAAGIRLVPSPPSPQPPSRLLAQGMAMPPLRIGYPTTPLKKVSPIPPPKPSIPKSLNPP